jgi:hypothetical protein
MSKFYLPKLAKHLVATPTPNFNFDISHVFFETLEKANLFPNQKIHISS